MIQSEDKKECVEVDVTEMSKDDRTKIHESVKKVFGARIVGSTVTKGDKKYIIFKKFNKKGNKYNNNFLSVKIYV